MVGIKHRCNYNLITTNKYCRQNAKFADNQSACTDKKCLYPNISLKRDNADVYFTGLQSTENLVSPDPVNKTGRYQCDTYFFRDLGVLEMMKEYLKKHFPQGTHIADFGCSNGEETRTIAMILDDINQDSRYTLTGYDPSLSRIVEAHKGEYYLGLNVDRFLSADLKGLPKQAKKLKRTFDRYFDRKPEMDYCGEKCFKVKKGSFGCIKYFDIGNINDVDKILKHKALDGKKTGVIVFKNAWYHLMQSNPGDRYLPREYDDLSDLRKVLRKIHRTLPENGILVTGALSRDHILGEYAFEEGVTVCDSPFHQALKDCGFEPIEESAVRIPSVKGPMDFILYEDVKVYTIWRKK